MAVVIFILMIVATLEAYVIYKQDLEVNKLKSRLWDMSGLEPVFYEADYEED
jgi:hypothetical protein